MGIYSFDAAVTPLAMELAAKLPVNRKPPRCKSYDRACVGACDFISAINADRDGWDGIVKEMGLPLPQEVTA